MLKTIILHKVTIPFCCWNMHQKYVFLSYPMYLWQSSSPNPPQLILSGWPYSLHCWSENHHKQIEINVNIKIFLLQMSHNVSAATHQHMQCVVLWEALRELPHLPRARHVNNVDVNILGVDRKIKVWVSFKSNLIGWKSRYEYSHLVCFVWLVYFHSRFLTDKFKNLMGKKNKHVSIFLLKKKRSFTLFRGPQFAQGKRNYKRAPV